MSQLASLAPISPETVARLEPRLDHSELCSCIFLLYDNVETALQHIFREIQLSSRKYLPVLDSALFRAGDAFQEGALVQWARFSFGRDDSWQDKLLEAFLIIKNFWIVKFLGRSRCDLELKFLPLQSNTASHIDLVRKALFLMMEDLTTDQWLKLQNMLTTEAKQPIPTEYCKVPECLLLILMSRDVLKVKKMNQRMDFTTLQSCLKSMDLYYWAQQLKDIEDVINSEDGYPEKSVINDVQIAVPRFDLDPQNPGTILIFNLESYDEKLVGNRPLSKRQGSHVDCERLRATFNLLGFIAIVHKDPSSKKILKEIATSLKVFCQEAKGSKVERCFVVAILAHGDKDGVFGMDGILVKWDSIRAELRSSDTVGLPRLLIIQACKGLSQVTKSEQKLEVVQDGPIAHAEVHSGNLRDLFELSASVSGFAAYRSPIYGSFFIHSLCKHILLFGRHLDLNQFAPLINGDFDNKDLLHQGKKVSMTSELSVTASKSLYLGVPERRESDAKLLVKTWDSLDRRNTLQQLQERQSKQEDNQCINKNMGGNEKEKKVKEEKKEESEKEQKEDRHFCKQNCSQKKGNIFKEEGIYQDLKALALILKNQSTT